MDKKHYKDPLNYVVTLDALRNFVEGYIDLACSAELRLDALRYGLREFVGLVDRAQMFAPTCREAKRKLNRSSDEMTDGALTLLSNGAYVRKVPHNKNSW